MLKFSRGMAYLGCDWLLSSTTAWRQSDFLFQKEIHTHTFHTHTYVCTIKADLPTCILLYSPRRHFLFPTMPFLCPTTTTTTTRKPYHWSLCLPSAPLCPAVQPWGVNPNSIKHLLKEDHARLVRDRSQRKYALKLNVFTHMHTHTAFSTFQHSSDTWTASISHNLHLLSM